MNAVRGFVVMAVLAGPSSALALQGVELRGEIGNLWSFDDAAYVLAATKAMPTFGVGAEVDLPWESLSAGLGYHFARTQEQLFSSFDLGVSFHTLQAYARYRTPLAWWFAPYVRGGLELTMAAMDLDVRSASSLTGFSAKAGASAFLGADFAVIAPEDRGADPEDPFDTGAGTYLFFAELGGTLRDAMPLELHMPSGSPASDEAPEPNESSPVHLGWVNLSGVELRFGLSYRF